MTSTGLKVTVHPVHDLDAAREVYGSLFGDPYVDQPYYVAYRVGEEEVGLDPNGHRQGMTGPVSYWSVPDVAAAVAGVVAAGGREHQAPRDVGGGSLTALVTDADGNLLGLVQDPSA